MLDHLPVPGQYYQNRGGTRVLVEYIKDTLCYPLVCRLEDGTSCHLYRTGNFYDNIESHWDLVALWEEPVVKPIRYRKRC